MATREYLVDDMDESEAAETVTFAVDGRTYEIDLNEKNAGKLRRVLQPFIAAGRPVGRTPARAASKKKTSTVDLPSRTDQMNAIREWARNTLKRPVSDRGRIPRDVVDAFNEAHSSMPAFSG